MVNIAIAKENVRRQTISLGTLNGGLWLDLPPSDIPKSGWTAGYNFVVGPDYLATPYLGRELLLDISTDEVLSLSLPDDLTVYGIGENTTVTGTPLLYVFIGDQIAVSDGSGWAWVDLTAVTNGPGGGVCGYTIEEVGYWTFTMMGETALDGSTDEYLICTCPGNKILCFNNDGTAFTPDTTDFYTGTDLKPGWSVVYKGRLWIGGDPTYPESIFGSVSATPSEWGDVLEDGEPTAASSQEVLIGNRDGDPIVAGVSKFGQLFVIKSRSVWYLNAAEPDPINWSTDKFNAIGGTPNCRLTIQDIGSDVIYMSYSGHLRSLIDTERSGMYDTSSMSSGQVRSWLRLAATTSAASCLGIENGWYLLALPATADAVHSMYAIYDFAKKTSDSPGLWYRIAPIYKSVTEGEETTNVHANVRSCFGRSTIFSGSSPEVVLSGDNYGRVYKEFRKTMETLFDDTGTDTTGDIIAWATGVHINKEDYTDLHILTISGLVKFGGAPSSTEVKLGVVVDPMVKSIATARRVSLEGTYTDASIWGTAKWKTMVWGSSPNTVAEANIGARGKAFAAYMYAKNAVVSISRLFVSLEEGRK